MPEKRSSSPAASARIATTSPRRTSACIPSASSGRSTARAATSISSIRKRSKWPSRRTPQKGRASSAAPRLVEFYHDVMAEMQRVTWPDMAQVRQLTIAIIVFVARSSAVSSAHRHHPAERARRLDSVALRAVIAWKPSLVRDPDHGWPREQGPLADPAEDRAGSARGRGAADPPGAGADAGSGRDQERQEGDGRAEDCIPGYVLVEMADEPGDGARRSTAFRA